MLSPLLIGASHRSDARASSKRVKRYLDVSVWGNQPMAEQLPRKTLPHVDATLRYRFYLHPCGAEPANDR